MVKRIYSRNNNNTISGFPYTNTNEWLNNNYYPKHLKFLFNYKDYQLFYTFIQIYTRYLYFSDKFKFDYNDYISIFNKKKSRNKNNNSGLNVFINTLPGRR